MPAGMEICPIKSRLWRVNYSSKTWIYDIFLLKNYFVKMLYKPEKIYVFFPEANLAT